MDPIDCQKQLAELSYKIRALEVRARNPGQFAEQLRLEYFEYLHEELVKKCSPNTLSKVQIPLTLPTGSQKHP